MLKHFIYVVILLSTCFGYSQNKKAEVLQKLLDSAFENSTEDLYKMKSISTKIIEIVGNDKQLDSFNMYAHQLRGVAHLMEQKNDSARFEIEKIMTHFENDTVLIQQLPELFQSTIFALSDYERNRGNYPKAYKILSNGLKRIDTTKHKNAVTLYLGLSQLSHTMGDEDEAEQLIRKSLRIKGIGILNTNLLYVDLGFTFNNKNLDSSFYYLNKAAPFFKKANKATYYEISRLIAEGHIKKGELSIAKSLLKEVEQYALKYNITSLGGTYLSLSEIASLQGKMTLEYDYLKKADSFLANDYYLPDKQVLFEKYASYYGKIKDFDNKFLFELKSKEIKDSIHNRERVFLTKELEVKYESDLKNKKILAQQQLIRTKKTQQSWFIFGLCLLVGAILFMYFLHKKRLLAQKELAYERINRILEEEKSKSIQSHLEGQNKERERIAKDLHDNISGNLAAIKLKMSQLQNQTSEIQQIVTSLNNTYHEVRTISHDLIPKKVSINTFSELIEQLVLFRNSSELSIILELFPKNEMNAIPQSVQLEIYSVLQELLTNIHKHSKASKGFVNMTLHNNYVNMLVEDNGIGFLNDNNKDGIGLKNIKSRIHDLKGSFHIESQVGTVININIPI
jgi:signal transduction histidine kinase